MASFLAGILSPALTAASEAVAGQQQGEIHGILESARLKREASQDALRTHLSEQRDREIEDRENALHYVNDASGQYVGLPKIGEHAASIASALPTNPSAGAGAPTTTTPDASATPSAGSAPAGHLSRAVQTGVQGPVKHGTTRIAAAPGGRRMIEQQQSNGAWSPALTAQGDTVFTPQPVSSRANGANAKTPEERDRDTHLHVLNEQINQTQKDLAGWRKVAQAAMNPAADSKALAAVPLANAKIRELSARSDSLTSVRDGLAGGLRQPGGATQADPTAKMSDADAWEYWRNQGLSSSAATRKVNARRGKK